MNLRVHAWSALALVSVLAACNGGGGGSSSGPVTVTVHDQNGALVPGAQVVHHDPNGEVIATAVTASNGTATLQDVGRGDAITTGYVELDGETRLFTFLGVEPEDVLVSGRAEDAEPTPIATVTMTLESGHPGAAFYQYQFGCSSIGVIQTGGIPASIHAGCVEPADTLDVVAIASDANDAPLAFAVELDVPISSPSIAVGPWRTDWRTVAMTVTNAPAGAADVYAGGSVNEGTRSWSPPTLFHEPIAAGASATLDVLLPNDIGSSQSTGAQLWFSNGVDYDGISLITDREVPFATSVTYDLAADLLPRLMPSIDETDADRPTVSWTTGGFESDGGGISVYWQNGGDTSSWQLIVPPDSVDVRLPALPDAMASFRPSVLGSALLPAVVFVDSDALDGYDAVRARGGASFDPNLGAGRTRVTFGGLLF